MKAGFSVPDEDTSMKNRILFFILFTIATFSQGPLAERSSSEVTNEDRRLISLAEENRQRMLAAQQSPRALSVLHDSCRQLDIPRESCSLETLSTPTGVELEYNRQLFRAGHLGPDSVPAKEAAMQKIGEKEGVQAALDAHRKSKLRRGLMLEYLRAISQ